MAELYNAIYHCKKGMVSSQAYILARMKLSTPLANQDVTSFGKLTAKKFYSKSLGLAVTAIP